MSDELKRHPPTTRRLARLRQAGDLPNSPLLTGAIGLLVATMAAALLGPRLMQTFAGMLASDLQQSGMMAGSPGALPEMLMRHLGLALGLIMVVGGTGVVAAMVVHWLQIGGGGIPVGHQSQVPWSGLGGDHQRRPRGMHMVLEGLLGLGTMMVLLWRLVARMTSGVSWAEASQEIGPVWWHWLGVLVGLGVLHWARNRAAYWQRASMSDRERREESREAEGAVLNRQRRVNTRREMLDHD